MRRISTLALCLLQVAFGLLAGLAHVHGSPGHDDASPGLHVDHAHHHLVASHGHTHDGDDEAGVGGDHADRHGGDAVDLDIAAVRPLSTVRVLPAVASVAYVIDPPAPIADSSSAPPGAPRDPPQEDAPRPRAPPV